MLLHCRRGHRGRHWSHGTYSPPPRGWDPRKPRYSFSFSFKIVLLLMYTATSLILHPVYGCIPSHGAYTPPPRCRGSRTLRLLLFMCTATSLLLHVSHGAMYAARPFYGYPKIGHSKYKYTTYKYTQYWIIHLYAAFSLMRHQNILFKIMSPRASPPPSIARVLSLGQTCPLAFACWRPKRLDRSA